MFTVLGESLLELKQIGNVKCFAQSLGLGSVRSVHESTVIIIVIPS